MTTFEELEAMLYEIADELPPELYDGLNGGVVLRPEAKFHEVSTDTDLLYILGEYHYDPRGLGRYIIVYYGSFIQLHGNASPSRQREKLKGILCHELTHHLESLAGAKDLEVKDRWDIYDFVSRKNRKILV